VKKFLPLICLLFIGCSKKNDNGQNNQPPNTVTINGQLYSTVVIGSQTWTTVNYSGSGGIAYTNSADNAIYGKFYTESEAKGISLPAGWRLPAVNDFYNLFIAIGANQLGNGGFTFPQGCALKLMSTSNWTNQNGTNDLGFNAEPAGVGGASGFGGQGIEAMFWSSAITTNGPWVLDVSPTFITTADILLMNSTDRASVRFVKDN
jgi:uncharacterized protein (TIGR02145 family)